MKKQTQTLTKALWRLATLLFLFGGWLAGLIIMLLPGIHSVWMAITDGEPFHVFDLILVWACGLAILQCFSHIGKRYIAKIEADKVGDV